ncbi:hypothetical protein B0H12DRAFT_1033505, partial [Mycena haematopus]
GEKQGRKVRRSLPNLLGLGLHLVEWDGVTPRPLVDKMGRIVAVLAGQPDHAEYREAVKLAFQAICDAGHEARFPPSMRNHRRGLFAAMNVGLSYGKGQKVPSWLNNKAYQVIEDQLLANRHIKRLAGFADGMYMAHATPHHPH